MRHLILVFTLVFLLSCKKEDSVLGLDVQPESDLIYSSYDESAQIKIRTEFDTGLVSSLNNLGVYLLGSYQDPVFGRTDANIYTNFILKDNITNVNTGSKAEIDSVVLSIAYKADFYGDTLDPLKINVHKLHPAVNLSKDSIYSSGSRYKYDSDDITEGGNGYTFLPRPASTVSVGGTNVRPLLRIRLNKTWFEENLLLKDDIYLKSSNTLQQIFKGLYITTSGTTAFSPDYGSVLYFSLFDANTNLTLYYHNFTQSNQKLTMVSGAGTAHFNQFLHDYGTAHPQLKGQIDGDTIITKDFELGKQNVFIQSMAGLGLFVELPDITKYCDSGAIAVVRAELVLKVDENPLWHTDEYQPPISFGIKALDENGIKKDIADIGGIWVGGAYNANNKEYVINMPRHINQLCNGKVSNHGFFIFPSESTSRAFRAVIGGSEHMSKKVKLRLFYTKLYTQ